jgi:hypothetical protein
MNVPNVFQYLGDKEQPVADKDAVLKLSAEINDGGLIIKVQETKKFAAVTPKVYPFPAVVGGEHLGQNAQAQDMDSLQVAVCWFDNNKNDVGHATNATPQRAAQKNPKEPRARGATWDFDPKAKSPNQLASWPAKVPANATHLEVIMVYTDAMMNPPTMHVGPEGRGADIPLIIGSFSADLKNGKWEMKANPDDVSPPQATKPKPNEYYGIVDRTTKILMGKTGYVLRARPEGLTPPVFNPKFRLTDDPNVKINESWRGANGTIIDDAGKNNLINNKEADTGYDIVPRP